MSELNQLKTMIDTLQRRRLGVSKQIEEFKVLQTEIAALYARANSDPQAVRKLQKLNTVMNASNGVPQQMTEKVVQMKKSFEQLGRQLRQLAPERANDARPVAAVTKAASGPVKKHRRSFA
jgi:phage-related protein